MLARAAASAAAFALELDQLIAFAFVEGVRAALELREQRRLGFGQASVRAGDFVGGPGRVHLLSRVSTRPRT